MSMNWNDMIEHDVVSDCCGATVFLNGICANCKDHCTPLDENYQPDFLEKEEE